MQDYVTMLLFCILVDVVHNLCAILPIDFNREMCNILT